MAFLLVVEGGDVGRRLDLRGERTVIGRHPSCHVVLDNQSVSRHHAQILESHGTYFVEDLRSRNGTLLNGEAVANRTQVFDQDRISICDVLFRFELQSSREEVPSPQKEGEQRPQVDEMVIEAIDKAEKSSIITTLEVGSSSHLRLGVNPMAKLKAVMEMTNRLVHVLELQKVLDIVLEGLFRIFPQTDIGLILLKDEEQRRFVVRATRSRDGVPVPKQACSETVVKQALRGAEAILSADTLEDERFDESESLSELRIRSMMCVPLMDKKETVTGVIQINSRDLRNQFSKVDLEILTAVASQVTLAIEHSRLHEELLRQRDFERDLEFATQVQLGFLPNERPKVDGYQFYDFYEAALSVGGDYFDYVTLPNGRQTFVLGDVAGKGVPAALLMARLYSACRYQLISNESAGEAMKGLNAEIASSGLGHRFITFVMVSVDAEKHECTIVNAGHQPPLLRLPNGKVEAVSQHESGLPLGVIADQDFTELTLPFPVGSLLLCYTDGVTEAMNEQGEIYHRTRLTDFLAQAPVDAEQVVRGLVSDVDGFLNEKFQRDDMCLVCLCRSE